MIGYCKTRVLIFFLHTAHAHAHMRRVYFLQSAKLTETYLNTKAQLTDVATAPVTSTLMLLELPVIAMTYAGRVPDFVSFTLVTTAISPVVLYVISYSANHASMLMSPGTSPILPQTASKDTVVVVFVFTPNGATPNCAITFGVSSSDLTNLHMVPVVALGPMITTGELLYDHVPAVTYANPVSPEVSAPVPPRAVLSVASLDNLPVPGSSIATWSFAPGRVMLLPSPYKKVPVKFPVAVTLPTMVVVVLDMSLPLRVSLLSRDWIFYIYKYNILTRYQHHKRYIHFMATTYVTDVLNGSFSTTALQIPHDADARNKYTNVSGMTLLSTPTGQLQWTNAAGDSRIFACPVNSDTTITLPLNAAPHLVDLETPQQMTNKTLNASDGNIVEATKLMGANVDAAAPVYTPYGMPRYEQVSNTWKYAPSPSTNAPLSLDPTTNVISATVGDAVDTLCAGNDSRFSWKNQINVKQTPSGGEFAHVHEALAEVVARGDASEDNRYIILVEGGLFVEPLLNVPDFVTIHGASIYQTIIQNDDGTHDTMRLGHACEIREVVIRGAIGVGMANVRYTGLDMHGAPQAEGWAQFTKVKFDAGYYHIHCQALGHAELYLEYVEAYGPYAVFLMQIGTNFDDPPFNTQPTTCFVNMESSYLFPSDENDHTSDVHVEGPGALFRCIASGITTMKRLDGTDVPEIRIINYAKAQLQTVFLLNETQAPPAGKGIIMEDGAQMIGTGILCYNLNYGLQLLNVGSEQVFDGDILTATCGTECVRVDHVNSSGNIRGTMVGAKMFVNTSNTKIAISMYDNSTSVPTLTAGSLLVGTGAQKKLDFVQYGLAQEVGLATGGELTITDVMDVTCAAGTGYVTVPGNYIELVSFASQTVTLPTNNTTYYIYIDSSAVLRITTAGSIVIGTTELCLGSATTAVGSIVHLQNLGNADKFRHRGSHLDKNLQFAIGSMVMNGLVSLLTDDVVTVGNGIYACGSQMYQPSGGSIPNMQYRTVYKDVDMSTWVVSGLVNTAIPTGFYNPTLTGGLVAMTTLYYARHMLFLTGDAASGGEQYFMVYGKTESVASATPDSEFDGDIPDWLNRFGTRVCDILVQKDGAPYGQKKLYDTRPYFLSAKGSGGGGGGGTNNHSALVNLASDDHLQYVRSDGTRVMTGNLQMGTFNVTNAGTYNGVTVEAHGNGRHAPNGLDPLPLGAAFGSSTVSASSTSSRGVAESYALSDHSHTLDASALPITTFAGTLGVNHGGTGVTAFTANRFLVANGAGALDTTTYATGAGDVVFTTPNQALTNKTMTDASNVAYARRLWSNTVYNTPGVESAIDTSLGPTPTTRFYLMVSSRASASGWNDLHDIMPIWYVEQDQVVGRVLTSSTWVPRFIDRVIADTAQTTPTITNPWNTSGFVTLANGGTSTARLIMVAGVWEFDVVANCYRCGANRLGLYNLSDGVFFNYAGTVTPAYGLSSISSSDQTDTILKARIVVPRDNVQVQIRHWCSTSMYSPGQGQVTVDATHRTMTGTIKLLRLGV